MVKARLRPCAEYRESLQQCGPSDLAWVAAVYMLNCVYFMWLASWYRSHPHRMWVQVWVTLPELLLTVALIALTLRSRGQPVSTIGIGGPRTRQSLLAGLAVTVAAAGVSRYLGALWGHPTPSGSVLAYLLVYYLVAIGFTEELVFRGFITPRLAACFRSPWIGVCVAGVLFSLSHLPFRLVMADWDVASVAAEFLWILPITFTWHLVLWWFYARWNNLAVPALVYLCINAAKYLV